MTRLNPGSYEPTPENTEGDPKDSGLSCDHSPDDGSPTPGLRRKEDTEGGEKGDGGRWGWGPEPVERGERERHRPPEVVKTKVKTPFARQRK